jgi:hypothetical protein
VESYDGNPLTGIESLVNQLNTGVPDTYIKSDDTRQIFIVSCGYVQGVDIFLNRICREYTFLSMVSVCFSLSFVWIMMGRRWFSRGFKKQWPTCLVTSQKRKTLSRVAADVKEKQELSKCEMTTNIGF